MVGINWDEAPEGANAAVLKDGAVRAFGLWRKFEDDKVYYYQDNEWVCRPGTSLERWKQFNPHVMRPEPVIVEAELPNGLQWIEGATHYATAVGTFFDEKNSKFSFGRAWLHISKEGIQYYIEDEGTIVRFPGAKPKVPVEAPVKKKPVGWWN